jgi:hypothetical protein
MPSAVAWFQNLMGMFGGSGGALSFMNAISPLATSAIMGGSVGVFADGGVFDKPTTGIFGEAGPEAVMPLKRDAGRLGVAAAGAGGETGKRLGSINVTVNGARGNREIRQWSWRASAPVSASMMNRAADTGQSAQWRYAGAVMIHIGTPVRSLTDDFEGLVTAHKNGPHGRSDHEVTTVEPLPRCRIYAEAELEPLDAEPVPYAVGSEVHCYAQNCIVMSFDPDADAYELLSVFTLPSGVEVYYRYPAVPRHDIDIWNAKPKLMPQQVRAGLRT